MTRLGEDWTAEQQNALIADVLERAIEAGEQSVKRGPDLLPVLREAGVVDAGGYAVTILFAGVVAALRGTEPPELDHYAPARVTHPEHESSTYRYCTNFAVTGHDLDATSFVAPLEEIGDSVLVVGDAATLKVHVHTDDFERAMAVFAPHGEVSHLDVADMHVQVRERDERIAGANGEAAHERCCGALAVVAGRGHARALRLARRRRARRGRDAEPVDAGDPRRHPPGRGRAGRRAPEQPERDHGRRARRRALRQGGARRALALAAGGARRSRRRCVETARRPTNAEAMEREVERLRTGAVARAARDDAQGRFSAGDAVGFVDDAIVAWGEPAPTLEAVVRALAEDAELLTCIAGDGAPLGPDDVIELAQAAAPEADVEHSHGGQPSYWWLLSAE